MSTKYFDGVCQHEAIITRVLSKLPQLLEVAFITFSSFRAYQDDVNFVVFLKAVEREVGAAQHDDFAVNDDELGVRGHVSRVEL